jgi:alpha-acetolactate decarboxylase
MKEQLIVQAQSMVSDMEQKLIERIKSEISQVNASHEAFRSYIEMRVGENHSYTNELKDEMDRVGERLKASQTEVLNYNKNMAASLKKIRADQLVQEDDIARAWTVVTHILDSIQSLMSCFESQANDSFANRQMAGSNNP